MTIRERDVDRFIDKLRDYMRLLIAADQGHIGVHESVTAAQADLRDVFKRALGMKLEERAEP